MNMRLTVLAAATAAALGAALPVSAQVVVGVAGPLTGANAAFGEQLRRGAEMAAAEINAKGGVNGQQVRLVFGDDAADPRQGVAVANKMATDKAVAVVGHFNSSVSIPASKVYNEEGILMITPASTNPQLTEQGFNAVFRTCGRDDQQGDVAGSYLAQNFKDKKVAIVHDNTTYGKGLADATRAAMNKAGLKEAMYEAINTGQRDFSALISKMKDSGVGIIYFGGLHNEAGLLIRQAREQNSGVERLVSGDGIVSTEYWTITGQAGTGTLMTFGPDQRAQPNAKDVVAKFRAANYEPEGYTLYSYAALQVWADAANKAKSVKADDVAKAMKSNTFQSVIGELSFDGKGDRKQADYVMYEWKDGKYAQIAGK
ncbi:MAG TPA: branched-chain amino acid ABC transporter substrate-binding protein [Azospirillaceae bacterium]|nr:branched-chain amino acid ABC transporter substrate-binding protein [Azospirillaceae bacterium]